MIAVEFAPDAVEMIVIGTLYGLGPLPTYELYLHLRAAGGPESPLSSPPLHAVVQSVVHLRAAGMIAEEEMETTEAITSLTRTYRLTRAGRRLLSRDSFRVHG